MAGGDGVGGRVFVEEKASARRARGLNGVGRVLSALFVDAGVGGIGDFEPLGPNIRPVWSARFRVACNVREYGVRVKD
jgi:hypothetical protein